MADATTSLRGNSLNYSSIRKLLPYAKKAISQGIDVIKLNIGDPDLNTPGQFINVLHNWKLNPVRYAQPAGEPELINSLLHYYHNCSYTDLNAEDIIVTVGGSEALSMAMFSVTDPGDEILVPEPFFANYSILAQELGVKLVAIPTNIENGFRLPSQKAILKLINKKTKAILYSSPGNPTGVTYNKKEITMLLEIALQKGLYLISDEVYREFIFTDAQHESLVPLMSEYPNNLIMLDSFSKRYNLCGARLGMLVTKSETVKDIVLRLANGRLSGGLIDQIMGSALKDVPKRHFIETTKELKKRRDVVIKELKKIEGVRTYTPEGAFYLMVELPVKDAEDFCRFLLEEFKVDNTTVMLAPGKGFYLSNDKGKNEVRIAYVVNSKELAKAVNIINKGLEVYLG
jgi:aspartate aminotransferase